MTYEEIKEIVGSDGTVSAESGAKGTEYYTIIYKWDGAGSVVADANFTFQGSPLTLKLKRRQV